GRDPAGLAGDAGVSFPLQLTDLAGYLGLCLALPVPPVGPPVRPDAHGHVAVPLAVAARVDRGPQVGLTPSTPPRFAHLAVASVPAPAGPRSPRSPPPSQTPTGPV